MVPSLYLFMIMYMLSFMIVLSCQDWFLIWFGLELNMISFIVLMYKRYSMISVESCLKYFFVQSLGSAIFMSLFYFRGEVMNILGSLVLTYKLGGGPFFFWFPSVCDGVDWVVCFMLMSLQKIIPLLIMVLVVNSVLWVMIVISLIVGVVGSFSQSSIKRLLAYSSIHHIGWLIMCQIEKMGLWMYYLVIYSMVLLSVVILLLEEEIVSMMDVDKIKNKWLYVFGMLNLGGMPPLLGFFLKWWALMSFIECDLVMVMYMIMLSVVMFYVYFRMVYDVVMGFKMESKWTESYFYKNNKIDMLSNMGVLLGLMGGVILGIL